MADETNATGTRPVDPKQLAKARETLIALSTSIRGVAAPKQAASESGKPS
jgi:hypothetical protein